jgi:hypothetical protein
MVNFIKHEGHEGHEKIIEYIFVLFVVKKIFHYSKIQN